MNRGKSWDIHGNSQDLQKTNELISSEQQFSNLMDHNKCLAVKHRLSIQQLATQSTV